MKKLLTVAGALLSMILPISAKAEPPKVPPKDDVQVEDYANNIIEYDDFEISRLECTKYGARTPTYDACHNQTNHNGACSPSISVHCAADNPSQCETIRDGDIVEYNQSVMQSHTRNNIDTTPHRHKYSVSTKKMGIQVTTCNAEKGQNETKTVQASVRKMCMVDALGDDTYFQNHRESCQCNIIKDNCGNYVDENGRAVYVNKADDGSCLGQLGRRVNCDAPAVQILGKTVFKGSYKTVFKGSYQKPTKPAPKK